MIQSVVEKKGNWESWKLNLSHGRSNEFIIQPFTPTIPKTISQQIFWWLKCCKPWTAILCEWKFMISCLHYLYYWVFKVALLCTGCMFVSEHVCVGTTSIFLNNTPDRKQKKKGKTLNNLEQRNVKVAQSQCWICPTTCGMCWCLLTPGQDPPSTGDWHCDHDIGANNTSKANVAP